MFNLEFQKKFWKLIFPMIIQSILSASAVIVDQIVLASVSTVAIAVVGIAGRASFVFMLMMFGLINGITIYLNQYIGAKKIEETSRVMLFCFQIILVISLIELVTLFFFTDNIISIFTSNKEAHAIGVPFIKIFVFSHILTLFAFGTRLMINAFGKSKEALRVALITLAINVILNFVLVYGWLGIKPMGVFGSVTANLIAALFNFVGSGYILLQTRDKFKFAREYVFSKWSFIKPILLKALPLFFAETIWSIGVTTYTVYIGKIGIEALIASQVGMTIVSIFMSLYTGFAQGTSILVGNALGANDIEGTKELSKKISRLSYLVGAFVIIMQFIFVNQLVQIFDIGDKLDDKTFQFAVTIVLSTSFRAGIGIPAVTYINGFLKSGGDSKFVTLIEVASIWVFGIPFTLIAYNLHWALFWVAFGSSFEQIARLIMGFLRYRTFKWMRNLTTKEA